MKKVIIIIILLLVVGLGYKSLYKGEKSTMTSENKVMETVSTTTHMMEDGTVMAGETMDANVAMTGSAGHYEDYTPQEVMEHAKEGKVVLFFKASWCPTCRTLDTDIMSRLKDIPKNIAILKVDYDNSTELKKKYGITYQHTFVQVDKDGNQIKKWSGSQTLAKVLSEIN